MIDLTFPKLKPPNSAPKHCTQTVFNSLDKQQLKWETIMLGKQWKPKFGLVVGFLVNLSTKKGFLIKSMPPILVCPRSFHNLPNKKPLLCNHFRLFRYTAHFHLKPNSSRRHSRSINSGIKHSKRTESLELCHTHGNRAASESFQTVIFNQRISRVFSATKPAVVVALGERKKAVCVWSQHVCSLTRRASNRQKLEENFNFIFSSLAEKFQIYVLRACKLI